VDEAKTLLLSETGIARLKDGSEAVNVGPIVQALRFLTEGRGDDRGTDELGTPLPDLLSLAFDVVQSIIVGGRAAEFFRKVKLDFDTQSGLDGRASLALAKQAAVVRRTTPSSALEKTAGELRARIQGLNVQRLDEERQAELQQALQAFSDFGAERWVAATSQLLLALGALDEAAPAEATPTEAAPAPKPKRRARRAASNQKPDVTPAEPPRRAKRTEKRPPARATARASSKKPARSTKPATRKAPSKRRNKSKRR
jgi:hypothetical protein